MKFEFEIEVILKFNSINQLILNKMVFFCFFLSLFFCFFFCFFLGGFFQFGFWWNYFLVKFVFLSCS